MDQGPKGGRAMKAKTNGMKLVRKLDGVFARFGDGKKDMPVRIVWARPVSGKGRELSILDKDKKEVRMLDSLDCLDPESRQIAREELDKRYLMPKITKVSKTSAHFGNRYWDVETDRGARRFLMKDPNKNVIWVTDDRLIIRDTQGNRYEIESFSALDSRSKFETDKII
jgi:hypothetical protein